MSDSFEILPTTRIAVPYSSRISFAFIPATSSRGHMQVNPAYTSSGSSGMRYPQFQKLITSIPEPTIKSITFR